MPAPRNRKVRTGGTRGLTLHTDTRVPKRESVMRPPAFQRVARVTIVNLSGLTSVDSALPLLSWSSQLTNSCVGSTSVKPRIEPFVCFFTITILLPWPPKGLTEGRSLVAHTTSPRVKPPGNGSCDVSWSKLAVVFPALPISVRCSHSTKSRVGSVSDGPRREPFVCFCTNRTPFKRAAVWCVPFCLDCSVPWVYVINFKRKKKGACARAHARTCVVCQRILGIFGFGVA